jgi:excisionase family DNA binding protein
MDKQPDTDAPELVAASEAPDPYANTLSAEEAAVQLGCSAQTIRKMAADGKLKGRLVIGKKGRQWRIERTGLLAPKEEDPMAAAGAMLRGGDIAQILAMWKEDRSRADALQEEVVRMHEQLAAERARAEERLRLLSAPAEAPRKPWWRVW